MSNKKDKLEVALLLLEGGDIKVHLDARRSDVVVPPGLKQDPHLLLQIGRNMPVPIPDLKITKKGIKGTLSFNRTPFYCILPWRSIYAVVGVDDSRGKIWEEDMPSEMAVRKPSNNLLN